MTTTTSFDDFAPTNPIAKDARETALFCKDILQAGVSCILMIAGTLQASLTELAALPGIVMNTLNGQGSIIDILSTTQLSGFTQILVAALLFASTRRGIARLLGLIAILGFFVFRDSGLTSADVANVASQVLHSLATGLDQTASSLMQG